MDNGQNINYAEDSVNPTFCVVAASLRIISKAKRLKVALVNPLTVYISHHSANIKCHYIDDTHIYFL